ncbi:hypothetical protein [Tardiphaga robiniae]|uniref:hypothetical protein n=1 Tax=Tardiphaga robiniae TaxID=943830 RepID=UPI001FCD051D|nr:hypothetical protein [Tardiphaga robiniae]
MNHRTFDLAVAPQAEGVAVGVEQIGQRLQLVPLLLVVRVGELARIGALAGRLDLDEADECIADRDRVVGPGLEMGQRRLADEIDGLGRQPAEFSQRVQQRFKRCTKLIFRSADDRGVGQL